MSMELSIEHAGGALQADGTLRRLKDLVPLEALGDGSLRIRGAHPLETGVLTLELSDGSERQVSLPGPSTANGPADLVIHNAGQILTMEGDGVGLLPRGSVACRDGRILAVLAGDELPELATGARQIDAEGGLVAPGLVDPHTHPVFAGERALEFAMKAEGRSYLEIHRAGGGIFSTVRTTRQATFDELARSCAENLSRLLAWGVTTCEGKSGYALELRGELRLLEVLRTVAECHPIDVEPTLLGAHALPPYRARDRVGYLAEVAEQMVPQAARQGLARFCDAYCEDGAFTPDEVSTIFRAAVAAGLELRLHAEQFTDQGGAALAASFGAASVDHLEMVSGQGIAALAAASATTTAVLLPGAALACRCPWPPARALIEAGVRVALGTDLNPGSSMTANLPLMMSLGCMQLRMTCEEVWRAVTVEAARSLRRTDIGRLAPGCLADVTIFRASDFRYIPYHYGENHIRRVIKRGRVVVDRG